MSANLPDLDFKTLRAAYDSGQWSPTSLVKALDDAISAAEPSHIWINRLSRRQLLTHARRVEARGPETQPLFGVPFAIKDNIDLARISTTAACPEFAYEPKKSAFVVQQLLDAGAIPIGKTNLDQFATGLVGVRSPYGVPGNAFDPTFIPGGSSSGSAIAVARGFASFALGTDTAGSGRVPAAFNNLVGLKPTRGLLSCSGVVPACRTLDCVSIFAKNMEDAQTVLDVAAEFDPKDSFARQNPNPASSAPLGEKFRFGIPKSSQLEFFGNRGAGKLFREAIGRLESIGGEYFEIDFSPFLEAARLLYEGPWVAERFVAIEEILRERPSILHPVTRKIIKGGGKPAAAEAFKAEYRLRELKRRADKAFHQVDVIATPTAGTIYTIAEVEADPIRTNSNLGYYTNFMNLLDFAATAVPAGFLPVGLPFGITLFGPAFHDLQLLELGARFAGEFDAPSAAIPPGWTPIVVCGAHMEGLALNWQLLERGARFIERTNSAKSYRFYALPPVGDTIPPRPGMVRVSRGGAAIEVEVWALRPEKFGDFVAQIPAPLGIGKVDLDDGRSLPGFICEPIGIKQAEEITKLGSWRKFVSSC